MLNWIYDVSPLLTVGVFAAVFVGVWLAGAHATNEFFEQPMLAALVKRMTHDSIELTNNLAIEVTTNDKRRVRGRTVVCAILDEVAHWRSEATANPDEDVYQAIKPAMATIPNALLIGISSPYSRRGLLWRKYNEHFGKPSSTLIARAPTWVMNPTVARDGDVISEAYETDPSWAAGEYGAEWRDDLEAFINLDAVRACIQSGVRERLPERRHRYIAFCDVAGGSGGDSYTLGIAHREADTAVLDCLREARPPFSPEGITEEFADLVKKYRITKVHGDRYGGEMPRELWRRHGINYEPSTKSKSQIYVDFLPLVNSGAVDLLEHDKFVNQLVGLERRRVRGGRDSIDHPPGTHDDIANAGAGAIVSAMTKTHPREAHEYRPIIVEGGFGGGFFQSAFILATSPTLFSGWD